MVIILALPGAPRGTEREYSHSSGQFLAVPKPGPTPHGLVASCKEERCPSLASVDMDGFPRRPKWAPRDLWGVQDDKLGFALFTVDSTTTHLLETQSSSLYINAIWETGIEEATGVS